MIVLINFNIIEYFRTIIFYFNLQSALFADVLKFIASDQNIVRKASVMPSFDQH